MTGDGDHPRVLLWYVTGDLEEKQAQQVERHVRWCSACRIEAQALSAALNTLRGDPGDHADKGPPSQTRAQAPAERSFRWHDPGAGGSPQAAGRDGWSGPSALLVAAAVGFAMALLPAWLLFRQHGPDPSIREARTLALSPPQRGHATGRIVTGGGPHAITLVLPLDAPEGTYSVRIEREDASPPRFEAAVSTHGDGTLTLLLESSPPPGRYLALAREPGQGDPGSPHVFPFEVASGGMTRLP